jgi:hypothetical protein
MCANDFALLTGKAPRVREINGSAILATIQFHVKDDGDCCLRLYDATLLNSAEQSTVPTVNDGHFSPT